MARAGQSPPILRPAEAGQASVEALAGIPALLLAGALALQLLAVGYSATLAGAAVEAGTIAVAAGRPAAPAVREAMPGWMRERVRTQVRGGRVAVTVSPPALLAPLGEALEIGDSAWVRPGS